LPAEACFTFFQRCTLIVCRLTYLQIREAAGFPALAAGSAMTLIETITATLFPGKRANPRGAAVKRGEDLRSVVRVPQRMRNGFLWADRLIAPRACMIKDLSMKGARVEVIGDPIKPSLLADGVKLYFDTEKHEIPCSMRWSRGQQFGLRFEGRAKPPSRKYR
jgi:hypothetical protein